MRYSTILSMAAIFKDGRHGPYTVGTFTVASILNMSCIGMIITCMCAKCHRFTTICTIFMLSAGLTELVILYPVETSITWNEDIYRHWPVFWHMLTLLVLSNDSFHLDFNTVICLWTWEGIEKGQIEMKVKKYDFVSCHQTCCSDLPAYFLF